MKWEYRLVYLPGGDETSDQAGVLNAHGAKGWELVQIILAGDGVRAYLKRPVPTIGESFAR
jgi:hypothetical protein